METTSRDNIAHKIKKTHPINVPTIPRMSDKVVRLIRKYLASPKPQKKLTRIRKIYELADKVINEIAKESVCRKGCSWCCAIPVEVTPLEIKYIEANTNLKHPHPLKSFTMPEETHNIGYCPLLDKKTGFCSVYEFRPYNCRTFLAYDSPEYCKQGYEGGSVKHWVTGGPGNGYGNPGLLALALDLIEADLGEELKLESKSKVEARVRDIRYYF